jgi:hypothetical protein
MAIKSHWGPTFGGVSVYLVLGMLLLLLRVLKAKVEQFHENSINFESEC